LGYVVDMFPQIVEGYLSAKEEGERQQQQRQQRQGLGKEGREGKERTDSAEVEKKKDEESKRPKARFWYPTLVLNLDIKKALPEPEGVEWLFVRVGAKIIKNGRMDLEILVLDEGGEVVAISTHAGLIMGTERNMAGRMETKERGGKESKL
jgi:Thioesterase-like superfamily